MGRCIICNNNTNDYIYICNNEKVSVLQIYGIIILKEIDIMNQ